MSNLFLEKRKKLNSLWKLRNNTTEQEEMISCPVCNGISKITLWESGVYVCPKCGYHKPISAEERVRSLIDEGTFREMFSELKQKITISFSGF